MEGREDQKSIEDIGGGRGGKAGAKLLVPRTVTSFFGEALNTILCQNCFQRKGLFRVCSRRPGLVAELLLSPFPS